MQKARGARLLQKASPLSRKARAATLLFSLVFYKVVAKGASPDGVADTEMGQSAAFGKHFKHDFLKESKRWKTARWIVTIRIKRLRVAVVAALADYFLNLLPVYDLTSEEYTDRPRKFVFLPMV